MGARRDWNYRHGHRNDWLLTMPLATKNNALIVKDGKLADGCGCCSCSIRALPDYIVVQTASSGTTGYGSAKFRHFKPFTNGSVFSDFSAAFACVAPAAGTYVLTRVPMSTDYIYDGPGFRIQVVFGFAGVGFWNLWYLSGECYPNRVSITNSDSPLSQSALESDSWAVTNCSPASFTTSSGLSLGACRVFGSVSFLAGNECRGSVVTRGKDAGGSRGSHSFGTFAMTASPNCVPPFVVSGTISGIGRVRIPFSPSNLTHPVTENEDTAKTAISPVAYIRDKSNASVINNTLAQNDCDFSWSVESCVLVYGSTEVPMFDPRFVASC